MIKIDVISGFLGAGKTTLIKKLFQSRLKDEKVVLIENEFGEIGVDGSFLKESGVEIKEINSGCICCSLVGDFSKSMKEIVEKFNPDRIIIEPSGVGKLSDIIKAIEKVEEPLKINIVATVVDGGKCKMYFKNFGEFYDDQIKQANTIVVSKTDKLSDEKVLAAVELIKSLNEHATIVTTPVTELDPNKLLGLLEGDVSNVDALLKSLEIEHDDDDDEDERDHCCHHHDEHEHHHHHHHGHDADEVFTSWGIETPVAFTHEKLEEVLKTLCDENSGLGVILRSKGVVRAKDNEKWYYFDLVAGEYEIRTGAPDYTGKICVIGSKIDEDKISRLFSVE